MPDADPVNWQPISQTPLIASMIDGALDDTRDHVGGVVARITDQELVMWVWAG
jgi:hypothetical protein